MIGNLSKSYVLICSSFSVVLIFVNCSMLHSCTLLTCAHLDHSSIAMSFAHQYVHTSFGLFIHNYFNCTSTCAHIFGLFIHNCFICTSTCAHILDYSSKNISYAHQHVHTSLYSSSLTISFAHQHVHKSLCTLCTCAHIYGLFIHVTLLCTLKLCTSTLFLMHFNLCYPLDYHHPTIMHI